MGPGTSASRNQFQFAEGRIGRVGQAGSQTINGRTVPWIWTVIEFDSAGMPDQVNTKGWVKAWTNLENVVEQTFTPSVPKLTSVEVELVVGNAGKTEDELTLSVLNANGRPLSAVTQRVSTANCDQVIL